MSPAMPHSQGFPGFDGIQPLQPAEFSKFRELIYRMTGISLSDNKEPLVASRLSRRLRALGLQKYGDYYELLQTENNGRELEEFVNSLTTNKTSFFREPHHFRFLADEVLPRLREKAAREGRFRIRIWSAGCSSGEEPYTIAMTVLDRLGSTAAWDLRILASDIDTDILSRAEQGIYREDHLEGIPEPLVRRFFRPATTETPVTWQVNEDVRRLITFRRINLIEPEWPVRTKFDVIFFRNVAIYFDRPTQDRVFRGLASYLDPDGVMMVGHSESLHWLGDVLSSVGDTTYRLRQAGGDPGEPPWKPAAPANPGKRSIATTRLADGEIGPMEVITVGGVYASPRAAVVRTLLGSCVAACLWDPEAGVGGMNHFLLPSGGGDDSGSARFGVHAMEVLINEIMKLGGDRRRLKAKVFGASRVLHAPGFDSRVPERNAEFIRQFLASEKIPIVGERLGGTQPLEVRFFTESGRAQVRAVGRTGEVEIASTEEKFVQQAVQAPAAAPAGDVELF